MTQEDQAARPAESVAASYEVTAYQRANVRSQPNTQSDLLSHVVADESYPAICWTLGEEITDNGVTNNVWIRLRLRSGRAGYVCAIYFSGDKYADLPFSARC